MAILLPLTSYSPISAYSSYTSRTSFVPLSPPRRYSFSDQNSVGVYLSAALLPESMNGSGLNSHLFLECLRLMEHQNHRLNGEGFYSKLVEKLLLETRSRRLIQRFCDAQKETSSFLFSLFSTSSSRSLIEFSY
ncbi:unnamed protein product [Arabis nemorensis]|uniref:Uncharacterized protein n=1 Tax=Arabis nemorensis TaxID=586526 RepID=A0A565C4Z0_9BRAS|nr:unnamed protein product [Arabis nemorensis]